MKFVERTDRLRDREFLKIWQILLGILESRLVDQLILCAIGYVQQNVFFLQLGSFLY